LSSIGQTSGGSTTIPYQGRLARTNGQSAGAACAWSSRPMPSTRLRAWQKSFNSPRANQSLEAMRQSVFFGLARSNVSSISVNWSMTSIKAAVCAPDGQVPAQCQGGPSFTKLIYSRQVGPTSDKAPGIAPRGLRPCEKPGLPATEASATVARGKIDQCIVSRASRC